MMFELPPSLTKMLSIYVSGFLPIISQSSGGFIFCSINGGRKHQHTLSEQIQAVISDRLGLRVTPNQFRHIAAKVHMQSYPGDVEGVRWLLGHWSIRSTLACYAEFDTLYAGKRFDEIVEACRQSGGARFRGEAS